MSDDATGALLARERELFAEANDEGYLHIRDLWSSHEVARVIANLRAEGREPKSIARVNGSVAIIAKRAKRKEEQA